MTTHQLTHALDLPGPSGALEAAVAYVAATGFTPAPIGTVGLELEFFVVDPREPCGRPSWQVLTDIADLGSPLPASSRISLEPGGQVELSTPPAEGVAAAVAALRTDRAALGERFAAHGLALVAIGADPARTLLRINPASRYAAMERHFDALGHGTSGRSMMTATASLQINVNAGPESGWRDRAAHVSRLTPVLAALASCSPMLAGNTSGWRSMRQQAWLGIDGHRAGPIPAGPSPDEAWGHYAMKAPVMLVRDRHSTDAVPVEQFVPFGEWWTGSADLGRPATPDDLDYHLTTLFPPLRPKGYLEFRPLDAVPDRWWPALAAIAVTLMDDPVAADLAADVLLPAALDSEAAARCGLGDATIGAAAQACVEIAAAHVPAELADEVARYLDLVSSGRTPGDELLDIARASGPVSVLQEEARA